MTVRVNSGLGELVGRSLNEIDGNKIFCVRANCTYIITVSKNDDENILASYHTYHMYTNGDGNFNFFLIRREGSRKFLETSLNTTAIVDPDQMSNSRAIIENTLDSNAQSSRN